MAHEKSLHFFNPHDMRQFTRRGKTHKGPNKTQAPRSHSPTPPLRNMCSAREEDRRPATCCAATQGRGCTSSGMDVTFLRDAQMLLG
ncbi:hypothetical protein psal_cds_811 [Pandoravirus salinus]|uniref:Uncharacterized protein n=1 Tax=Pandoravirus salinus TaxID=1349410 RepID=S4VZA6_9VIRU|nr:hypothetical protein psal_cds_811 [Pandoravirus salinus]AGO84841.2 hypothetical protein psal_cds_811 [Pandoravirus salinus]